MSKIFIFDPQIYPLKIWVVVKTDVEVLKMRFDVLDDDNETLLPFEDDTIKSYWGAARITVKEKESGFTGCLIAIVVPQECTAGMIAHEASHAYDDFVGLLGLPKTGECRAYLTEWIVDRVWEVFKKKIR